MTETDDALRIVRAYHARTKHHPERYAASPGYLDWETQPDPFRVFVGAPALALPHPPLRESPTHDALFAGPVPPRPLDADLVGRLFYHSLALSAWKRIGDSRPWSLRINPSSGALHPTEGYLIADALPGLTEDPGVFHYAPLTHRLERRARPDAAQWADLAGDLPRPALLVALTSIPWRESWKYGERAFRYCHHDVGHALYAVAHAARTLGWSARWVETTPGQIERLVGAHTQAGPEAEHGDALIALFPNDLAAADLSADDGAADDGAALGPVPPLDFVGEPNALSAAHRDWPAIDEVAAAVRERFHPERLSVAAGADAGPDRDHPAEAIIRRRRSAVAMDGETVLDRAAFHTILRRTLPGRLPLSAPTGTPQVSLALFVHRVEDLEPGLYALVRDPAHAALLREALSGDFAWRTPPNTPDDLPLLQLGGGDLRAAARAISCHQDIAADGVFSLGMLARFDATLSSSGPGAYTRLFWETGMIGQALYLEAEAAGMRGTGIGCFFDDVMHDLLGIDGSAWQSLYHFTVGGPREDPRLRTHPPYAHLDADVESDGLSG